MASTELLKQAAERQSEVDDAVAAYLAKGGEIQSCPEKNHIKANLDYYKHRAKVARSYRKEKGIKEPRTAGKPHLIPQINYHAER
jgi:hypothetical protein